MQNKYEKTFEDIDTSGLLDEDVEGEILDIKDEKGYDVKDVYVDDGAIIEESEAIPEVTEETPAEKLIEKKPEDIIQTGPCFDTDVTIDFPDGRNYNVKGSILINGQPVFNGIDFCSSPNHLSEWYCAGPVSRATTYKCTNGCSEGVCVGE